MVGYYNQGVPTTVDLENNSNQKKYTVNKHSGKGLYISKPLCALLTIGAMLLALLAALIVFFLIPRCSHTEVVENLTKVEMLKADEIDERLPRSIVPTKYRIHIIPDFENLTTSGTVTIIINAKEDTNNIVFHINKLEIDKHSLSIKSLKDSSALTIKTQDYIEGHRYEIVLNDKLKKGDDYALDIKYTGELNKQLQGFYKIGYETIENGAKISRIAASTQFSPTDARRAFPCFDEPSFKAKFTISIARPSNMTTLSNMPLTKSDVLDGKDWYWDHYPETPEMSTYLVAFMVTNLKTISNQTNFIHVWSQSHLLPHTMYVNGIAPKMLEFFENYFNIKFPLKKIDIAAVPEFGFSAMENWGLITFRESSLLYDESSSTIEDKRTIATVLGHEIAHQWFGNLVTPKWWNDLWLKEGFATYLEYLAVDHAEPDWKIIEEFMPSETLRAFKIDSLESSRPISFEVKNSKQIRQTFDEISYSKGACIIRMMNHFLGEETFKRGLINFLIKYQYKNADRNDLFECLTEEAHKTGALQSNESVKVIMDTWTEQAGFPVITAVADYDKNKLKISQKRFLYINSNEEGSSWWVPISITSNANLDLNNTKPTIWLRGEKEIETDINVNSYYLLNIKQTGYYIVNYDEKNWRSLISNIMNLPPLIRAQLISDSMDLARANLLDYDIPLKMIAKMAVNDKNIMFIPTLVSFEKLKFLSDILSNQRAFGIFEEYHSQIFEKTYEIVNLNDMINDYLPKRIRNTVLDWSCRSTESKCSHIARGMFRTWMAQGRTIIPDLREIVYCTSIRDGSEAEWNFAYRKYLETDIPSEKNILLDALGCTHQGWLLSNYLNILLDKKSSVRIQDADRVFESVARNKIGTNLAFDFLRRNWNQLVQQYGDGFNILAKMIKSLAPHMNTEFQLEELIRFRDSIKNNESTTKQAFENAIEIVKGNVEWMKKNYNSLEKWLTDHKNNYNY